MAFSGGCVRSWPELTSSLSHSSLQFICLRYQARYSVGNLALRTIQCDQYTRISVWWNEYAATDHWPRRVWLAASESKPDFHRRDIPVWDPIRPEPEPATGSEPAHTEFSVRWWHLRAGATTAGASRSVDRAVWTAECTAATLYRPFWADQCQQLAAVWRSVRSVKYEPKPASRRAVWVDREHTTSTIDRSLRSD